MEDLVLTNPLSQKQIFIKRAREKFGERFDYSKVKYAGMNKLVTIIDNTNGNEFEITPYNHIQGETGLPVVRIDTKEFIRRSKEMWGEDTYDYSKTCFVSSKQPITLICRKHNYEFTVKMAQNHISKSVPHPTGCPYCSAEDSHNFRRLSPEEKGRYGVSTSYVKLSEEEKARRKAEREAEREAKRKKEEQKFLERKAKVAEYYDVEGMTNIQIAQLYGSLIAREKSLAGKAERDAERERKHAEKLRINAERRKADEEARHKKWIEQAKEIHPEYNYDKTYFAHEGKHLYMYDILCPVHGYFKAKKQVHINFKCKCAKCAGLPNIMTADERKQMLIDRAIKKFGPNRFDYSRVEYTNKYNPVWIRCIDHNYWFQTRLDEHSRKSGCCPYCVQSSGEAHIRKYLEDHHIRYEAQYQIPNPNPKCKRGYLVIDFYLPQQNMFIEFNGQQHYEDIPYFFDKDYTFEDQQIRDQTVRDYCKDNGIRLLEIKYSEENRIPMILTKTLMLK